MFHKNLNKISYRNFLLLLANVIGQVTQCDEQEKPMYPDLVLLFFFTKSVRKKYNFWE